MIQRLYQVASEPSLVPTWQNADGTETIYLTGDPSVNEITLTIQNDLTGPLSLPAGTPVAFGTLPAGQSAIYLLFNGLIANTAVDAATMTAAGWSKPVPFTDPDTGFAYLAIAPVAAISLAVGAELTFTIANLTPTGQATSGNLDLYVAGAGLGDQEADVPIYVNVANPPQPPNKELDLLVGFSERDEVFTGATAGPGNELLLYLTNPGQTALVPGGHAAWGASPPQFQIDLVYGDSQGALTDTTNAAQIHVNLSDDYGNEWNPVEQHVLGSSPYWQVQPNPAGPATVLGTGANATVVIALSNIVTTLPQGLTYLYLSYKDIPGYNDGFFAVEIVKVDPITVSLTVSGQGLTPGQATLQLEANNASYVMIPGTSYGKATTGASFQDQLAVQVEAPTTFTLVAANYGTGQLVSTSANVPFAPPSVSVQSFVPSPSPVKPGASSSLAFTVQNATYVTITGTNYGRANPGGATWSDSVEVTDVRTTTSYTLLAFNTETGQVSSQVATIQVSPEPLTATSVGGLVNIDSNGNPVLAWSSSPCTVSLFPGQSAGYQLDFPPGTFASGQYPTVSAIPWGIAGHTTAPLLWTEAWYPANGSLTISVLFTQTMPGYTAGPTGFWFTVVQAPS